MKFGKKSKKRKKRCSRSPCGERGLKSSACYAVVGRFRRSPCGERGLKFCV